MEKTIDYLIPDGIARSDKAERKLNELAALTFSEKAGEDFLKYLRSISIEMVSGPNLDPNALIHLEGMRFLVGIIEQRVNHGRNRRPDVKQDSE